MTADDLKAHRLRPDRRSLTKTSNVESCEGPIDRVALLQMIHGPECNIEDIMAVNPVLWSEDPVPMMPFPSHWKDFTGTKRGSGVVIGFFGSVPRIGASKKNKKRKGSNRNYWVIKCLCGGYQIINQKTLRTPESNPWMCQRCSRLRDIRRGFGTYKADYDQRRVSAFKQSPIC